MPRKTQRTTTNSNRQTSITNATLRRVQERDEFAIAGLTFGVDQSEATLDGAQSSSSLLTKTTLPKSISTASSSPVSFWGSTDTKLMDLVSLVWLEVYIDSSVGVYSVDGPVLSRFNDNPAPNQLKDPSVWG